MQKFHFKHISGAKYAKMNWMQWYLSPSAHIWNNAYTNPFCGILEIVKAWNWPNIFKTKLQS